jgi:hypothetical protein
MGWSALAISNTSMAANITEVVSVERRVWSRLRGGSCDRQRHLMRSTDTRDVANQVNAIGRMDSPIVVVWSVAHQAR